MEQTLYSIGVVVGRITEKHLDEAEKTFPGILEMYESLRSKPATFLQLVFIYETTVAREHASYVVA